MDIVGPSDFKARVGERITVEIKKSVAPYSVTVSSIAGGVWSTKPDDHGALTAVGDFVMPNGPASFTDIYNFIPGPAPVPGDFYTVTITGQSGAPFVRMMFPPGNSVRTYSFSVAVQT